MSHISKGVMIIVLSFLLAPSAIAHYYARCQTHYYHYYRYHSCYYHHYCCRTYYYPYYYLDMDGEVDNACVDACLDYKHTLNQCVHSCYY